MKVLIIGGGAAGMFAAIEASKTNEVIVLEKMPRLGTKLSITGKGRCNVTNACDRESFFEAITRNSRFMQSSFSFFNNKDTISFFENIGISLKIERGQRVFPISDSAKDIVLGLKNEMIKNGVKYYLNTEVSEIEVKENKVIGVILKNGKKIDADAIILATGGTSYKGTGSTGDGYNMLRKIGLKVIEPTPSLVPLETKNINISSLMGISLRNIGLSIFNKKGKRCFNEMGEMLFTHFGISGPLVLKASSIAFEEEDRKANDLVGYKAEIDFKPALDNKKIDKRLQKEMVELSKKDLQNVLRGWLPANIIPIFLEKSKVDGRIKMHEMTKENRKRIINSLKHFSIEIKGFRKIEEAIITRGGLDIKEVSPKTMESKHIKNLFICGEVLDIDGLTGGFNLQVAFSTAHLAGSKVGNND